jgi:hypothetical protein
MTREPKYKIGQTVYIAYEFTKQVKCKHCGSLYYKHDCWKPLDFKITGISDHEDGLLYLLDRVEYGMGHGTSQFEEDIYPTEVEAQIECCKRNAERQGENHDNG